MTYSLILFRTTVLFTHKPNLVTAMLYLAKPEYSIMKGVIILRVMLSGPYSIISLAESRQERKSEPPSPCKEIMPYQNCSGLNSHL